MSQSRLDWLITDFTERVAHVAHAIVVSAAGVTLAKSAAFPEDRAGQLAAITCGLGSLMDGTAQILDAGPAVQGLVEMTRGLMLVKAISGTAVLAALAASECDIDLVAYEMTMLVEEVGEVLTPRPASASSPGATESIGWRRFAAKRLGKRQLTSRLSPNTQSSQANPVSSGPQPSQCGNASVTTVAMSQRAG